MKTTLHILHGHILGVGAALLVPFLATAAGPSGSFTNTVTGPSNAVWDFGGILTNANIDVTKDGVEVQTALAADFTQSGQGKVSGADTGVPVTLNILGGSNAGSVSFPATVTEKGSINSTQGGAHLIFSITGTGTGTLPGESEASRISVSQQINATINNANQTIIGSKKETASASGAGSITQTTTFSNSVSGVSSDLGDGSWTLILNSLSTSNNQVTGTATITLDSEQSFNYSVKGSFNSTKGTKLVLTGSDAISKGSAIQVTLDANNVVRNIKGRITGQMVNANF
jgi:hypothetical protein